MVVCKKLRIYGRVQGVGFRYWFSDRAQGLGLKGWVRNRLDGTVEAIVQGEPEAVNKMIEYAEQGADFAHVDRVEVSDSVGAFKEFEIVATR